MGWTEVLQSGRLNYLSSNFVLLRLSSSHVYNSINAILLKVLEIRYLMTSCLVPYPKNYISEGNSYFHYTLWGSQNPPFIFSTLCCCCSGTKSCPTLWTPWATVHQAPLSSAISQSLLKLMSIELAMPHNHFILCCPLHLLPSIFPSIRIFSNELALHIRWPNIGASASVLTMNMPLVLTNSRSDLNRKNASSTIHKVTSKTLMTLNKRWHMFLCNWKCGFILDSKSKVSLSTRRFFDTSIP